MLTDLAKEQNSNKDLRAYNIHLLENTWMRVVQDFLSTYDYLIVWPTLIMLIEYFDVDSKRYDIVEIERPNCAYIMLEVLSKETNITRGVHLIKMEGKTNIRMVIQP